MKKVTFEEAKNAPLLSEEKEYELIRKYQDEDESDDVRREALGELLYSYARLAYRFASRQTNNEAQRDDFAQNGIEGLMIAADKFDTSKGFRFSTYAQWWVRTKINNNAPLTLSVVDMPTRTFSEARAAKDKENVDDKAYNAVHHTKYLDAPLGESDETGTVGDKEPSDDPTPEEMAIIASDANYVKKVVGDALEMLPERERIIIQKRRLSGEEATLESLAQELNITRERVRQLEQRAFKRLQNYCISTGFSTQHFRET